MSGRRESFDAACHLFGCALLAVPCRRNRRRQRRDWRQQPEQRESLRTAPPRGYRKALISVLAHNDRPCASIGALASRTSASPATTCS